MNVLWVIGIALVGGGTIGVFYDRYSRRHDLPPTHINEMRLRRLHVVDDERDE